MHGKNFHPVDFVIFIGLFVLSALVGAVFAYRDHKKQSVENYYFGGRRLASIPLAISIAVSFISAITVIGGPAEVYLYGNIYCWYAISLLVPTIFGIVYYVPLIHSLRISSIYEYLELRYHRNVKIVASILGILNLIAYLAIAVFVPSLALSAVTPLKLTWTIVLTSMTCTLYTTLGGMKAVIWVDVLQSIVMLFGMAAVFVRTLVHVGGFGSVASAAARGGRDNMLTFYFDPRVRSSAITIFAGGAVSSSYEILCNQIFIQRWLACKTIKSARTAIFVSVIPLSLFYCFTIGNGLVMYAYYEGCDPMLSGEISKPDQLVPRLAVDVFYDTPGLAGLFVSAAFCGTLSTVSSGLNAMSALGLMDHILPCFPSLTSKTKLLISKALTVVFGLLIMLLAYAMSFTSSNVIEISNMLAGFFAGPLLGVYTMGIMMPWINDKGAMAGFACGFAFTAWVGISSMLSTFVPDGSQRLPLSDANCTIYGYENSTFTTTISAYDTIHYATLSTTILNGNHVDHSGAPDTTLYALSVYMYGPIGLIACVIGAHAVCLVCGFNKPSQADPRLFLPLMDNKLLPRRVRKFFRFGVPELVQADPLQIVSYTKGSVKIQSGD